MGKLSLNMKRSVERLVLQLQANIGSGYHPDTTTSEYTNDLGPDQWDQNDITAIAMVNALAFNVLGDDVYKICLKELEDRMTWLNQIPELGDKLTWLHGFNLDDDQLIEKILRIEWKTREGLYSDEPDQAMDDVEYYRKHGERPLIDYTRQELMELLVFTLWQTFDDDMDAWVDAMKDEDE
jgi:hypothetical protein